MRIGEPYPKGLSEAVYARLNKFQAAYDELPREKDIREIKKEFEGGMNVGAKMLNRFVSSFRRSTSKAA
jgi:hypothetical protein